MFTLGNKEAIVNNSTKFAVTITGDVMRVDGFGSFHKDQIKSVDAQRYVAPRVGAIDIKVPSAGDLGIDATAVNVPVVAHIRVNTSRHSSEWAIDFIKRGRPFIFEIMVNGGQSGIHIATTLMSAMKEYELKFNYSDKGLPFTYSNTNSGAASDIVHLLLKDSYLSFQNYVDFTANRAPYGVKADTTKFVFYTNEVAANAAATATTITVSTIDNLLIGDTIQIGDNETQIIAIDEAVPSIEVTPALEFDVVTGDPILVKASPQEPTFDGKYLEENVRMSLTSTTDVYAISAGEVPVIKGGYSTISWVAKDDADDGMAMTYQRHKSLGVTRGEVGGERRAMFTLYLLEGTDMFVDAAGNKAKDIIDFLVSTTAFDVTKDLKIANLAVVADSTLWLA